MSAAGGPAIAWFRRDLRLHDHPALSAAIAAADEVLPLFVFDDVPLRGRLASANRAWYLLGSLAALRGDLRARRGDLWLRRGRPAEVVSAVASEVGAVAVYASGDTGPYARRRDEEAATALAARGIRFNLLPGTFVAAPGSILGAAGRPYSVFTPFRRAWEAAPRRCVLQAPERVRVPVAAPDPGPMPSLADLRFPGPTASPDLLPEPGEAAARARLDRWTSTGLSHYADRRDLLAVGGTSRLGQDLHLGLLSPAEVLARCDRPGDRPRDRLGDGPRVYASELCWRDFYAHVLWHFPHCARRSFRREYDARALARRPGGLRRVDATAAPATRWSTPRMRQLRATGWMHNRARMIVASFLTKDLLIDWRSGERHFMRHLVDGDLASNNGGWQWAASTGTDAQPYFRIFNPVAQGQRFDPDGDYVRRWVPELARAPVRSVHAPWTMPPEAQRQAGCIIGQDYPPPIVDHAAARERALAAYRSVRPASS